MPPEQPKPQKEYEVTITIAFTMYLHAESKQEAIEQAQECIINEGEPDTLEIVCYEITE